MVLPSSPSTSLRRPILLCLVLVGAASRHEGAVAAANENPQLRGLQLQQPQPQPQPGQDSLPSSTQVEDASSVEPIMSAAIAEYREKDGEYEVVVRRVPIRPRGDNGLDHVVDPWMKMALAEGVDLNEYNVTYEGGTWETLEEDHRRNLISVNAWENNNARYCVYERNRRGIAGLSWSVDLIQQAQQQASYMAAVQHIEHRYNLAEGVAPGWRIIAENVCQNVDIGYGGAFMSLMNDQDHRDNILNVKVNYVGVGVARDNNYYYMCQVMKGT